MAALAPEDRLPLPLLHRGKVREVYDLGTELLIVASDRLSAFDVVLPTPVPGKGEVLTLLSAWWFRRLGNRVPHHYLTVDPDRIAARHPVLEGTLGRWARRAMLVRRCTPLPVECVVRGYLAGSAWAEYQRSGTVGGVSLPRGLREGDRLEPPFFSPATKARVGHDENIDRATFAALVGAERAATLETWSRELYALGAAEAQRAGLLLADTKFEFGVDAAGRLRLIDEVLTPDSSRYWLADAWRPGAVPPSLDKQPVRDWLEAEARAGRWAKCPPAPPLPPQAVAATRQRYRELFRRLTGLWPEDFPLSD